MIKETVLHPLVHSSQNACSILGRTNPEGEAGNSVVFSHMSGKGSSSLSHYLVVCQGGH